MNHFYKIQKRVGKPFVTKLDLIAFQFKGKYFKNICVVINNCHFFHFRKKILFEKFHVRNYLLSKNLLKRERTDGQTVVTISSFFKINRNAVKTHTKAQKCSQRKMKKKFETDSTCFVFPLLSTRLQKISHFAHD